jgi:hypothetical protein
VKHLTIISYLIWVEVTPCDNTKNKGADGRESLLHDLNRRLTLLVESFCDFEQMINRGQLNLLLTLHTVERLYVLQNGSGTAFASVRQEPTQLLYYLYKNVNKNQRGTWLNIINKTIN